MWQAANNGNAYAQYLLGKLYLMGEGVPKDADAAYQWFTKAYYGGHTYAGMFMDRIDRKRLAQLRQKRIALGHKPDDHELEPQGYTMQFH